MIVKEKQHIFLFTLLVNVLNLTNYNFQSRPYIVSYLDSSKNNALIHFFYKNVIFGPQAQNFLKNPYFSLKKLLVLTLFPGSKLS